MKRKSNLYENMLKMENIEKAYSEVCIHTKNKKKVRNYKEHKCIYISRIYNILKNRTYEVGKYNVFTIYEPKERLIVSQNLQDKVINHLISRQILYPALIPCLINENVASLENKGTRYGIELATEFHRKCKIKYGEYYILKCDISKFFASIGKDRLKEKLAKRIKDKEALNIVYKVIDSQDSGLGIGNMTSQVLAIFYLNDMDHFIKEELKIKYYVRYQDDFLLFHQSKEYLKYCMKKIEDFLKKENLRLNRKSRILKSTNNFIFLGRNKNGRYAKYRDIRRKIKKMEYLYNTGKIDFVSYMTSRICYKGLTNNAVKF